MDPAVISALHCLESDHQEQLDFEDENLPLNSYGLELSSAKLNKRDYEEGAASSTSGESSGSSEFDEGEMKSSDESEFSKDEDSSEEGEVQSEIDEIEVTLDTVVKKNETPWERGLRLARERLERVKALKAKEKNLAEKRMNLPVPAPLTEKKSDASLEDDYLWPCYYQAYIIGRTELTGHRYLPEDLITPSAAETAEWRRRVTKHHRGRGNNRRRSGSQNYSSRSSSSSVSSSSRSSSRSSNASSNISSLASVALSWKETCAKAMKPFLRSPNRRRRYDSRHSSDSNSRSSDSDSGSARSHSAYHTAASGARYGAAAAGRNRNYWGAGKHRGRNIESGRSSASRSDSNSSVGFRGRTGGRFGRQTNLRAGRRSKSPGSPPRRRTDIPPLPSERPVKRPWVAAPSLAAVQNLSKGDGREKLRSRSSSGSRSPFGKDIESKQFITSWSRSPSSGGEARREVLPDVVPAPRIRGKRIASPLRRKKSRSPFADDAIGLSAVTNSANITITTTTNNNNHWPPVSNDRDSHTVEHIEPELYPKTAITTNTGVNEMTSIQQTGMTTGGGAGELPSNRPGVRLTLAPRMKPAPVGISSLASAAPNRSTTNRPPPQQPSSPPRQVRHLGVPVLHRHTSPIDPNHPPAVGTTNNITMPLTQSQVRLQAEAAAAALEIRERRRAAAEAANKHRRSRRHKRTDLKNIPVLGRPTYRRQSFSASSGASGSSNLSHSSRSPSGGRSHSESGKPIGVRHGSPPMGRQIPSRQDQEVRSNVARKRTRQEAAQRQSLKEIDENATRRHTGRSAGAVVNSVDSREPMDYGRHIKQSDFNERTAHRMRGIDQFGHDTTQSLKRPYPSGYDEPPVRERLERDPRISGTRYPNALIDEPHSRNTNAETRRVAAGGGQTKERIVRPRTPHGLEMIDFNRRSPHGDIDLLPKILRLDREQYRRVNYDIPDISAVEKSTIDIGGDMMIDNTDDNFAAKRARSRHRSRGPGGTIDRSEPFESDTGSFAAEQRLRKLRERLNLVDDAIAEIKAGTGAGVQSNFTFNDIRR
ncbi:unnamed protein product [Trichobilharzia szidati]|nr:unnamed protein product [Trichobilharzia szidati]CAH8865551.1 unnamed protein product [Trichobilharzia szidati]